MKTDVTVVFLADFGNLGRPIFRIEVEDFFNNCGQ
jgi:hypothetical protein